MNAYFIRTAWQSMLRPFLGYRASQRPLKLRLELGHFGLHGFRSAARGASAFSNLLTHVYKTRSEILSRLATSKAGRPLSMTCRTTGSLNATACFVRRICISQFQY